MYTAQYRPDGKLTDMTPADIELVSEWPGDKGKYFDTLVETGLIDEKNGTYCVHDWKEHNPWAANAPQRTKAAKKAITARWEKKYGSIRRVSKRNTKNGKGKYPSPSPSPIPSPSPSPSPSPKEQDSCLEPEKSPPREPSSKKRAVDSESFKSFWEIWPNKKAREAALRAWKKINPTEHPKIMLAVPAQIKSGDLNVVDITYCPHPATWLNDKRWNDDLKPSNNSGGSNGHRKQQGSSLGPGSGEYIPGAGRKDYGF
jgi:hypothetical protein